ncbi:hypothetical protein ACFYVL_10745 [Streptomyces sp. NPDC004111]|uniref:hypothetical protein n=1 Tax=Streptomyces sp. NPDC004111 TaxID=3364690 RepID=UPI0036B21D68
MGRTDDGVLSDTWTTLGCVAATVVTMGLTAVYGAVEAVRHASDDRYDPTVGGGPAALGPLVLLVLFTFLAVLHACLLVLPVETCARLAVKRFGGPLWAWALPPLAVLGLLYAAFNCHVFPVLGTVPLAPLSADLDPERPAALLPIAGWIAATAGLALLGVGYFRRRDRRRPVTAKALVGRVAAVTACVCVPLLAYGATRPAYEPPRLDRAAYVGDWGEQGGAGLLRLGADGRATAVRMPYDEVYGADEVYGSDGADRPGESGESGRPGESGGAGALGEQDASGVRHCDGVGTWRFRPETTAADARGPQRDRVEVELEGCPGPVVWQITGTAQVPELFSSLGDPDAGLMVILRKRGG